MRLLESSLLILTCACSPQPTSIQDAQILADGGTIVDARGLQDSSPSSDSGAHDGDAPIDTGASDARPSPLDAMVADAEVLLDARLVDASPVDSSSPDASPPDADLPVVQLPPANAGLDYQLGGAYPPPAGVQIVSRDRTEAPAPGLFNICYVNGFQAQPDEADFWLNGHPDLILRDRMGQPVIDPDWDEMLLDVTTEDKRTRLAAIVLGWITGCQQAGYDAVEIDNLDTYSRSNGLISQDNAVAFIRLLADGAHARGMAIAQKNSAEILSRRSEMGTDFVVAEECNRYSECDDYTAVYADQVYVIEYRRTDFDRGCRDFPTLSIVLRDRNLLPAGQAGHVYDGC